MARQVAPELTAFLAGHPLALVAGVLLDLAIGDPPYRWHPVRLIGRTLTALERLLRRIGADGYGGGIALCALLAALWVSLLSGAVVAGAAVAPLAGWMIHVFLLYSLLALGDLLRHVWRIERALVRDDIPTARAAIARLVGRDTAQMDAPACRRAAVESLSENLTDGFTSPVLWYAVAGIPGLVLFKVASTLDSMVGYKTPRYLTFGWCGARLDDAMSYLPARATWLSIAAVASVMPDCSGAKALAIGWRQHSILPGPNAGWSEAAAAGALERRLVGPIWMHGTLVTDVWIGAAADPPLETHGDVARAMLLVAITGIASSAGAAAVLSLFRGS
jgi:adenosylcobinamide-phosphate synthase